MSGVEDLIRQRMVEGGGSISFERYMEDALYHPDLGYYSRSIRSVGRRGDFSTSASLGDFLGEAVARWALGESEAVAVRGRWHLIEAGGGNGDLAASILRHLRFWHRRRFRYHIVEISRPLFETQQQRLAGCGVEWHSCMREALMACQGRAILFSNELVDAFPCIVLVREPGKVEWRELRLMLDGGRLRETLAPLSAGRLPPSTSLDLPPGAMGQRIEIHAAYHDWLADWAPALKCGVMLTLDYGGAPEEIYHRRPGGTVRAYAHHLRLDGNEVYRRFGKQDLTADVNFSDMALWGTAAGFENEPLLTQADFLARHIPRFAERCARDNAAAFLAADGGAGTAFKALCQRKS